MGSCYGYTVHSDQPLRYCRGDVPGLPSLSIIHAGLGAATGDAAAEWEAIEGQRPSTTIHRRGSVYEITIAELMRWDIDVATRTLTAETAPAEEAAAREAMMWGTALALQMTTDGHLGLHAGSVDVGGAAVLFAGEGRQGKTTLTAAFQAHGYRMLADDLSAVALAPAPAVLPPTVLPGPAVLRMRSDAYASIAMPDGQVTFETEGKTHLSLEHRGDGAELAARALLFPEFGTDLDLVPIAATEVIRKLWPLTFQMPTADGTEIAFTRLGDVAAATKGYRLIRPKTYESLPDVIKLVVDRFGQ